MQEDNEGCDVGASCSMLYLSAFSLKCSILSSDSTFLALILLSPMSPMSCGQTSSSSAFRFLARGLNSPACRTKQRIWLIQENSHEYNSSRTKMHTSRSLPRAPALVLASGLSLMPNLSSNSSELRSRSSSPSPSMSPSSVNSSSKSLPCRLSSSDSSLGRGVRFLLDVVAFIEYVLLVLASKAVARRRCASRVLPLKMFGKVFAQCSRAFPGRPVGWDDNICLEELFTG